MQHCDDCGTCCELYDHHCDMLNVCITSRNFKYFFLFFFYVGLQLLIVVISDFVLSRSFKEGLGIKIEEDLMFCQAFGIVFGLIFFGVAFGFLNCAAPLPCSDEFSIEIEDNMSYLRFRYQIEFKKKEKDVPSNLRLFLLYYFGS